MEQNETPKHAVIYYDVLRKLKISVEEYIILDMVYYLEHRTGYCYKSAASMAGDLGMEKRAIQYLIQKLIKRNLLERLNDHAIRLTDIYINTAILYKKSVGDTKNLYPLRMPETTPVKNTNDLYPHTKNWEGGYKKMSKKQGPRYTYRNTIKNNTYKDFEISEPQLVDELKAFIDYRLRKSKGFTQKALDLNIANVKHLYPNDPIKQKACINQSIANGWSGLFNLNDAQSTQERKFA